MPKLMPWAQKLVSWKMNSGEDDGTVTYRPDGDFNGIDTFQYTVCDAAAGKQPRR